MKLSVTTLLIHLLTNCLIKTGGVAGEHELVDGSLVHSSQLQYNTRLRYLAGVQGQDQPHRTRRSDTTTTTTTTTTNTTKSSSSSSSSSGSSSSSSGSNGDGSNGSSGDYNYGSTSNHRRHQNNHTGTRRHHQQHHHHHHDCNNNDIAKCVELLEVLTNKDLGFAATVDELNNMCPVLLSGLQCIDDYTRRCLTQKHRDYFNKLYAGTIRVIKDLCNTRGRYQEEYIRHAPCMRQVNPKYNVCSVTYHEKTVALNHMQNAAVTLSEEEKNKNVIILCCSFQEYLQCSERVVFETCGNETALFTKEFLDRMAGPIVQFKCTKYAPGSRVCETASSASITTATTSKWVKIMVLLSLFGLHSDILSPRLFLLY